MAHVSSRRIHRTTWWSVGCYALRGLLPTVFFLKQVHSVRQTIDQGPTELCILVLFYSLTELLPLVVLLFQLRISTAQAFPSRSSINQASPSINSVDQMTESPLV